MKNWIFSSLRNKLMIASFFGLLFVVTLASVSVYREQAQRLEAHLEEQLLTIAANGAFAIDGGLHKSAIDEDSKDSEAYKQIQFILQQIKKINDLTYVYTMVEKDNEALLIVDAETGEDASPIGETYELGEEMKAALQGTAQVTKEFHEDAYGVFKTGYAPFYDTSGKIAGVLAVDLSAAEILAEQNKLIIKVVLIASLVLVIGVISVYYLSAQVSKPIVNISSELVQLAQGRLDLKELPVKGNDELGKLILAFNKLLLTFRDLIQGIEGARKQVNINSSKINLSSKEMIHRMKEVEFAFEEITNSAKDQAESIKQGLHTIHELTEALDQLATGAQEQAVNIGNTALLVNDINQDIKKVEHDVNDAARIASKTAVLAVDGGKTVKASINSLDNIRGAVLGSGEIIEGLNSKSVQIGEIVSVISEIAEQTNLLALNAAIEAARAGEHGKGFAVVAEEVRKLASRSGEATKRIADLVSDIQSESGKAFSSMEIGIQEVNKGAELADTAAQALDEILTMIEETNKKIQGISNSTKDLSTASQKVISEVDSVAAITQENSASAEEMSATTYEMRNSMGSIANHSEQSVALFKQLSLAYEEVNDVLKQIQEQSGTLEDSISHLANETKKFKL